MYNYLITTMASYHCYTIIIIIIIIIINVYYARGSKVHT